MPKDTRRKASRLSAEEDQLEKQRHEIMRRQQELEKRLKHIPVVLEQQEEQRRKIAKLRAAAAAPAISSQPGRSSQRRSRGKTRSLPSRQRTAAKIKTLTLLVILAIIFFILWNKIPTS